VTEGKREIFNFSGFAEQKMERIEEGEKRGQDEQYKDFNKEKREITCTNKVTSHHT
jgi:hypothetical protein